MRLSSIELFADVRPLAWAAVFLLALTAGCGPKSPYPTVKVRGKVTYDDGTPIPGHRVVVRFVPQVQSIDGKQFPKPGWVELQPDGSFTTATTWKAGDGVIPGAQKVLVQSLDERQRSTGAVGPEYGLLDRTPLTTEIAAGGTPIELTIARPKGTKRP